MKKLLFLLASAFLAVTASAQPELGENAGAVQAQATKIVERGVSGKTIGGDYGYTYVFHIVMHTDEYGHVFSVEPTGKVYRDDRWISSHVDVTAEVLRESRVTFDPASGECYFSYSCEILHGESWRGEGTLSLH